MTDLARVEIAVDEYIKAHSLGAGARLPSVKELAAQVQQEEQTLIAALEAGERKFKVARDELGWRVIFVPDQRSFSFSRSAKKPVKNDLIEAEARLPHTDERDPFGVESLAHKSLGLADGAPMLVIARSRFPEGETEPNAIHRAYLDPSRFPPDFINNKQKFEHSLIDIYNDHGYKLLSRDTVLRARALTTYEKNILQTRYRIAHPTSTVLHAEQLLWAEDPKKGEPFVLEFLNAIYMENVEYTIHNRI